MDVQQQVKPKNLLSGVDLWGRNCVNPAARGALRLGLGLLMTNKVRGRVAEVGDALVYLPFHSKSLIATPIAPTNYQLLVIFPFHPILCVVCCLDIED